MTAPSEKLRTELNERIAFQQRLVDRWMTAVDGADQRASFARMQAGFAWFDIGICHLLLEDATVAFDAIGRSASLVYSSLELASPPARLTYTDALASAILSRNAELAREIAEHPAPPEPGWRNADRLAWALALPALVLGDRAEVERHAEVAMAVADKRAWYPGIGQAMRAAAAGDEDELVAALNSVLVKHGRYATAKQSWCYNSGPCLICIPAAVLCLLVPDPAATADRLAGRRAHVPLRLVHSTEGEILKVELDFVPRILVGA